MEHTKEYYYYCEEDEYKANISELTKTWIEQGHEIIEQKYWALWEKCVSIRLSDLYRGKELGDCLDIVGNLNNGCTYEKAKDILDSQNHSNLSWGLIVSMVISFCERGEDFARYVNMSEDYIDEIHKRG